TQQTMNPFEEHHASITRRHFFRKSALGIGTLALGGLLNSSLPAGARQLLRDATLPHFAPKAKRVIYLFQNGAPSHVDLYDYKPQLRAWHGRQIPDELINGKRFSTMTGKQVNR